MWETGNRSGNQAPALLVVVDTEETFDWNGPFRRDAVSVAAMAGILLGQQMCETFAICPTYVVDFPVVAQEAGYRHLLPLVAEGRAEMGAHLHPWVNPPHNEAVTVGNSFPGNLPPALEAEKLHRLGERIQTVFGVKPVVYKAGRYGFGPHTAAMLEAQGYLLDLSPAPPFDFRAGGGPDFSAFGNQPVAFGQNRRLWHIPTTGAYIGRLRWGGHRLHTWANRPGPRRFHLPGILSRTGLLERIRLSPEGFSLAELKRLTCALLRQGVGVFSFSFHSPSLTPGCTPYVRNDADLRRFLDRCRQYFHFFLNDLGGITMTPQTFRQEVLERLSPTLPPERP